MRPVFRAAPRISAFVLLSLCCAVPALQAGSATWQANPVNADWYTTANWNPATIPNGPDDTATFGTSQRVAVTLPAGTSTELATLAYVGDAGKYATTISGGASLNFTGSGVTNNSGHTGFEYFNFNVHGSSADGAGSLNFFNHASALSSGSGVGLNTLPPDPSGNPGGRITFHDDSSAGNADFTDRGEIDFYDRAIFDADVTCFGAATDGVPGGILAFFDQSATGSGFFILNSGQGGRAPSGLYLNDDSSGDGAELDMLGNGFLDISGHHPPGVKIYSLDGLFGGVIFLGGNNLTVSRQIESFIFTGVIQDGGSAGGSGGSLTKVDPYFLRLTGASTYTGGTTIEGGTLLVQNQRGSATGSGPVQVNAGVLGGNGAIAGDVIVGLGGRRRTILAPGKDGRAGGLLTIGRSLTLTSSSTYNSSINSATARAAEVVAKGVTIASGATIAFFDHQGAVLPSGTSFTLISNTAPTPIAGTFDNLADGATVTIGANSFEVSYEGGDGNDLTLTVVP